MRIFALSAIAAYSFCLVHALAADPLARYDDHSTSGLTRVSGRYVNANYGFAFALPQGQVGWRETAPSPNHGVYVYLGARRSIEVDASYDSALLGSTDAVADAAASYVSSAQDLRSADQIDGRPAERVVQSWPTSDRRRVVVARWQDVKNPGDAVNFVITLETTKADYAADKKTLDGIVASFRFVGSNP